MADLVEMMSDDRVSIGVSTSNGTKMTLEPIYDSAIGFTYILNAAYFALNTVNEIVALTTYIGFSIVCSTSVFASDSACSD